MDLGLEGRVAIVTGGSRGIGREVVRELLEAGARVMTCSRNRDQLETTCQELARITGGTLKGSSADMTKPDDIQRLVDETLTNFGTIDILVNNAGTMYSGRFEALTDDGLQAQLDTKLFGFLRTIRAAWPTMRDKNWGRIVNMIGGAGKEPDPYMFGSGMTNSALLNLTKSLSTEFAPHNVLVNAVCPGWVATDLWKRNAGNLQQELGVADEEEARRLAAKKNALGRFGRPEELANAIVFLCSERASY
ncbi:MAG: SDR family NAD(P)-dependent oxidoreductase, partial [bacterium]